MGEKESAPLIALVELLQELEPLPKRKNSWRQYEGSAEQSWFSFPPPGNPGNPGNSALAAHPNLKCVMACEARGHETSARSAPLDPIWPKER